MIWDIRLVRIVIPNCRLRSASLICPLRQIFACPKGQAFYYISKGDREPSPVSCVSCASRHGPHFLGAPFRAVLRASSAPDFAPPLLLHPLPRFAFPSIILRSAKAFARLAGVSLRRLRRGRACGPLFLGAPLRVLCADTPARWGPAAPSACVSHVAHGRVPPASVSRLIRPHCPRVFARPFPRLQAHSLAQTRATAWLLALLPKSCLAPCWAGGLCACGRQETYLIWS